MKGNFLGLVGFEYKKILKRKSTYLVCLFMIFFIAFFVMDSITGYTNIDGEKAISRYEAMKRECGLQGSVKGNIDANKISEALEQYKNAYSNKDNLYEYNGRQRLKQEANVKYILPYYEIVSLIKDVYAPIGQGYTYNVENITKTDIENFYQIRNERLAERLIINNFSDTEIKVYNNLNNKINKPFYYDNYSSYIKFFMGGTMLAMITALCISICIAPMFSGEYSLGTDQLILTSKNGKNRLICAKIFTGITFSMIFSIIALLISFISILFVYSFSGANVSLQVLNAFLPYPLTLLQTMIILLAVMVVSILLVTAITLLLSAVLQTSFGVIIIINLLLFVPMFLPSTSQNSILNVMLRLLPTNMFNFYNSFSDRFFIIGNLAVIPYIFIPLLCVILMLIIIPITYSAFKKHQIS